MQVLFAAEPNRKAILFIHGFNGDTTQAWSDFHHLLLESPKAQDRDIFFYGYDGLRAEMNASASLFRGFLDRLFTRTPKFVNDNLPAAAHRPADFGYDELVIVAHSLGAVIARRALLDAPKAGATWASKTRLVLYAPAHTGAKVADLALETASAFKFVRFFAALARFESPLIDQLRRDSPELKSLLADTQKAREGGANPHLVALRVVIAEYERIVGNDSFADDPPPQPAIPGTTHISVCKPRGDFRSPLEHLEACL